MHKFNQRILMPLLAIAVFALALWLLHRTLGHFHYHDIVAQVPAVPATKLLAALLLTVCSYLVLTVYDLLAVRYISEKLAPAKVMLASFASYALSNTIGLSLLMAGSVRYRLYSAWGVTGEQIVKLVGFTVVTFWLGLLTVGGVIFIAEPLPLPTALHLPWLRVEPLGWLFLLLGAIYLIICRTGITLQLKSWSFRLPTLQLGSLQLLVGALDWTLAGSVLYVLLPVGADISLGHFLGIYLLVQIVALISHVPGGLGVFESLMVLFLPSVAPAMLIGSLLLFRAIYYLLPLLVATLLLIGNEMYLRKVVVGRMLKTASQWSVLLVPQFLAVSTFVGGAILLISGATPAAPSRLAWLEDFLPLPILEISHFLGSLIGAILLVLARGLQRRLDAAYLLTAVLLGAGSLFSLFKGGDWEEALLLGGMLLALLPCHRHFYRKSSLLAEPFSLGWLVSTLIVVLCSTWLGFFAFKHVNYTDDLWWRFSLHADAPRFMRSAVGIGIFLLLFSLARLLRSPVIDPHLPEAKDLALAVPVIRKVRQTVANLALLGDKALLFSEQDDGFVMYGVEKKSWVALGDPVGSAEVARDLAWHYRDMVEKHGGQTIFYEVGPELLHVYLDMGLTLFKIGETARVPLVDFSLSGAKRSNLRYIKRRLEKEGYVFEVRPADQVTELLPRLKDVSDAWLTTKKVREKGFSLGCFDEDYLRNFPVALVMQGEEIIAFANLWTGADLEELSIDLMRYRPESPNGMMDYLFVELILWGQQQGYRYFDLGMAPLSGLESRRYAPLWHRVGAFIFRQGEHFYNFEGLRAYKQKFDPIWEPRYLACPGGLALPQVLLNVSALISGGLKGLISK